MAHPILKRFQSLTPKQVFTSKFAFRSLLLGLPILTFLAIGGLLASINPFKLARFMGRVGEFIYWGVILWAGFVVLTVLYLTFTKQWIVLRRALVLRWIVTKDRFLSVTRDMRLIRRRFAQFGSENGILLAMAGEDKLFGDKQAKITYVDDRHVTLIGGTRAGKGTSFIVPNLLHHKGSVIVYDPAGENFALTAAYRQQVLGQKIVLLDPFNVTEQPSDRWNPLSEIDFISDPKAMDKCYALAESLIEISGNDPYWSRSAQELLAMMCAYIGIRAHESNIHLAKVFDQIHGSDLKPLWLDMTLIEDTGTSGIGGAVKRYGQSNLGRKEEELNSVLQVAKTGLRFLGTTIMRDILSGQSFTMRDLKDGNTSIYVVMPSGAGSTYKGWLRLLFNSSFDAMQDMSIETPEHPTLLLMDEFPLLGNMERIKRAAGEAAKFGVKLFICAQDITQLKEIYGEAWETFIGNSGVTIMFANNDLTTQNYLSAKLGKEYYRKTTTSYSEGGSSSSSSLELRSVARADEVIRQTHRATGTAYVLIPEMKPMHLPRAPYYAWNMIPEGLVYTSELATIEDEKASLPHALFTIAAAE